MADCPIGQRTHQPAPLLHASTSVCIMLNDSRQPVSSKSRQPSCLLHAAINPNCLSDRNNMVKLSVARFDAVQAGQAGRADELFTSAHLNNCFTNLSACFCQRNHERGILNRNPWWDFVTPKTRPPYKVIVYAVRAKSININPVMLLD